VNVKVPNNITKSFKLALGAQAKAYCPYSRYSVGAAVVSHKGKVFVGCNVENASFGGTVCAERVAVFKAVSEGHVCLKDVVVITNEKKPAPPCALCLQVLAEFCGPDTKVWLANKKGIAKVFTFNELLPHPFGPRKFK